MNLYPDLYLKNVTEITLDILNKNDIKGLILDVDNTLIDYDKKLPEEFIIWAQNLKEQGIKMCILSNTNKREKVAKVANKLKLEYIFFAHKPNKKGFFKAKKILRIGRKKYCNCRRSSIYRCVGRT